MEIKGALARIVSQLDLSQQEMQSVMREIMTGKCSEAQIGAFLMGLRMKSESIDEIVGAATVMRELVSRVELPSLDHVVDVVGTGGDGANIFNVSSAAAFVIAAAGGKVAKHGNRAVSGKSGSADLLEKAGIYLQLSPEQVSACIQTIGVGFMFAPQHHPAMRYAAAPRRDLGLRTLFNMLGPITNPAGVQHQLMGVFSRELCRPMAEVLQRLGSKHVLVVHARDGLDEISLASPTQIVELKDGEIREYTLQPEDVGIQSQTLIGLTVNGAEESLELVRNALGSRSTDAAKKAADMIALNAGAAVYAADLTATLKEGVDRARDAIDSRLALEKLEELAVFSSQFRGEPA
ncbi:Anthranilate phosphoribosyltransferase [gamma proteobacterium HdN1]|nr:Anthranilate phosphoribosyltransferase [gamma proteobacterium HdN1]